MSHPILERHLEGRKLRPLYLFYGEEEFLLDRALRRLEAALTEASGEAPLRVVREAPEVSLEEFLAEARVSTLWGSAQLLVLRRVETYPPKALAAVTAYLDHPALHSVVVLVAPSLKVRDVEKHPVFGRLQKEEAALGFSRLREGELLPWLAQEAKRLGKTLTQTAAQRLVEVVGDNLSELHQELKKLVLFAGDEPTLTPQQVSQLASHSRSYNIFALVDALGEAGAARRLAALDHLLDLGEEPARILAMLARQLRLLIRYKENASQTTPADLAKMLKLAPWQVKRLNPQAQKFTVQALRSHLRLLHQVDMSLKTSTANPRVWLEYTLIRLGAG
jgi:DNA polymerase-3 subunit delta|uniref:DNA-directed DNA polymerase n=1 Tax=Desulfobacca acetoxidans TaxID=60893 RepID=A0A7C3ZDR9_9BACT